MIGAMWTTLSHMRVDGILMPQMQAAVRMDYRKRCHIQRQDVAGLTLYVSCGGQTPMRWDGMGRGTEHMRFG